MKMPYHVWGDDWPYWNDLYAAEIFIWNYVYRRTRCRVSMKEKYGTLRYSFVYPPHPRWLYTFVIRHPWKRLIIQEQDLGRKVLFLWSSCWLYYKWANWGGRVLKKAVLEAIKRWPYIKDEINCSLVSSTYD